MLPCSIPPLADCRFRCLHELKLIPISDPKNPISHPDHVPASQSIVVSCITTDCFLQVAKVQINHNPISNTPYWSCADRIQAPRRSSRLTRQRLARSTKRPVDCGAPREPKGSPVSHTRLGSSKAVPEADTMLQTLLGFSQSRRSAHPHPSFQLRNILRQSRHDKWLEQLRPPGSAILRSKSWIRLGASNRRFSDAVPWLCIS